MMMFTVRLELWSLIEFAAPSSVALRIISRILSRGTTERSTSDLMLWTRIRGATTNRSTLQTRAVFRADTHPIPLGLQIPGV